jgi:hypothetical protein
MQNPKYQNMINLLQLYNNKVIEGIRIPRF